MFFVGRWVFVFLTASDKLFLSRACYGFVRWSYRKKTRTEPTKKTRTEPAKKNPAFRTKKIELTDRKKRAPSRRKKIRPFEKNNRADWQKKNAHRADEKKLPKKYNLAKEKNNFNNVRNEKYIYLHKNPNLKQRKIPKNTKKVFFYLI